jgi:hypothetical protein
MFHKTQEDAAQHLGVGASALRDRCGKEFGFRWPSRKVHTVRQMLLYYEEVAAAAADTPAAAAEAEAEAAPSKAAAAGAEDVQFLR